MGLGDGLSALLIVLKGVNGFGVWGRVSASCELLAN